MPLVAMKEMLEHAAKGGYAVGYFEAWDQYSLEAVLEAAEEIRSPVILGFGGVMMNQAWFGDRGLRGLGALGRAMAERSRVPVAYLLNEVLSFEHVLEGLDCGFNAVMLDTSHLPFEENIARTREVVLEAAKYGADVEGECDPLPDASGFMGEEGVSGLTSPARAAQFVRETGVAALSVSIGNEHIRTQGESDPDYDLLGRIHEAAQIPLVIHGGTGYPDRAVPRSIALGVRKFNVGSVMKKMFLESVKAGMCEIPAHPDFQELVGSRKPGDFLEKAKRTVTSEVQRRMRVYLSAGKA